MGEWPMSAKALGISIDPARVVQANRWHCRKCGKYYTDMEQAKANAA